MKIEILKLSLAALVGAFIWAQFAPEKVVEKDAPLKMSQVAEQECKTIITKRVNPDGSVDEVTEFLAKNKSNQNIVNNNQKAVKKYSLGLSREYDFKNQVDAYELKVGRQINDSLGVFLSYNTKQVAGVGVEVKF